MFRPNLMIIDAPNIDMSLSTILNRKPCRKERPDFGALLQWATDTAGDTEAAVFANVPQPASPNLQPWINYLLDTGYRVFLKPKDGESDIDCEMVSFLRARHRELPLRHLTVVSNDARNFLEPLEDLAHQSNDTIHVTMVGFREFAGSIVKSSVIEFRDLEEETGGNVFAAPLPRFRVDDLPTSGAWFEPRKSRGSAAPVEFTDVAAQPSGPVAPPDEPQSRVGVDRLCIDR